MFVKQQAAGLVPLKTGETTATEKRTPVDIVADGLQTLMKQNGGLDLQIEGEAESCRIFGEVGKVRVGTAWIGFAIGDCVFRTKTPDDRNAFWTAVNCGTSFRGVCFLKVCGNLPSQAKPAQEAKRSSFFPLRSKRRWDCDHPDNRVNV